MKIRGRLLLLGCLLLGALNLSATPWGGFAVDPQENHTHKQDIYFILAQLSSGNPIHIYMQFTDAQQEQMYRSMYQKEIVNSYNKWFKNAVYFIKQNKRQKEFVRMLARLNKHGKVVFVSGQEEADLLVKVLPWDEVQQRCRGHESAHMEVMACVLFQRGKLPVLYAPQLADVKNLLIQMDPRSEEIEGIEKRMFFEFILPHEIGHTLGLADQYNQMVGNAHRMYRSTHVRKGLMHDARYFTCDDADGLVNLVDIIHGTETNRKQGWNSLCVDSPDVYVDGIAKGTGPYIITSEDQLTWNLETYQRNKKVQEKVFTFDKKLRVNPLQPIPDTQVLARDELDRPVRTAGPNGETIYYMYNYEARFRLITLRNQAVRVEYFKESEIPGSGFPAFNKLKVQAQFFVNPAGTLTEMMLVENRFEGKVASYREGPANAPTFEIELEYTTNGRLKNQKIPQQPPAKSQSGKELAALLEQKVKTQEQSQQLEQKVALLKKWSSQKHN